MQVTFAYQANPQVSVVVLAWKLTTELDRCLQSIMNSINAPTFEVIIVKNGAEPSVITYLDSEVEGAIVVDLSHNVGFGQACNRAASVSKGNFLLFINDDAIIDPSFISNLYNRAVDTPDIGAVAGLLLNVDGSIQEAGSKILSSAGTVQIGKGIALGSPEANSILQAREIDYGSGAALLVAKKGFEKVGGFDPRYEPAYYEDVDLCLSLKSLGLKVLFEPLATLTHISGASTDRMRRFREFAASSAGQEFKQKWADVLPNASEDVSSILEVPYGCIDLPDNLYISVLTPDEIQEKVRSRYLVWLESELARFNPFDYEMPDELAKTREQLALALQERENFGKTAHNLHLRLQDLENRNLIGIAKWQLGKIISKKKK